LPRHAAQGPVAQLAERVIRIDEVSGSTPLRSTNREKAQPDSRLGFFFLDGLGHLATSFGRTCAKEPGTEGKKLFLKIGYLGESFEQGHRGWGRILEGPQVLWVKRQKRNKIGPG
jgi:hypothetical protein